MELSFDPLWAVAHLPWPVDTLEINNAAAFSSLRRQGDRVDASPPLMLGMHRP